MNRVLVIGGGFAGLWAAAGAARKRSELGLSPNELSITLLSDTPDHVIRVRLYETDIDATRIPLAQVLDPIDVEHHLSSVHAIDLAEHRVADRQGREWAYDRLVLAAGSSLFKPPVPGLAEFAFNVDTFAAAKTLNTHLDGLRLAVDQEAPRDGRWCAVVVGAGLTGVEVASEMITRLRGLLESAGGDPSLARVVLIDRSPHVGSNMGEFARPVIEEGMSELGVELRMGTRIGAITPEHVVLEGGEIVATRTVIWTAGMRASELTAEFPVERDRFGRIPVDNRLKVVGVANVFAAGDVASLQVCPGHESVMSCQHARPMGRFAGHNVVADLAGEPLLDLSIPDYVTILDMGEWGALYTTGWNREVAVSGPQAKSIKETINRVRIYPPTSGNAADIFAAAAPQVQTPPPRD